MVFSVCLALDPLPIVYPSNVVEVDACIYVYIWNCIHKHSMHVLYTDMQTLEVAWGVDTEPTVTMVSMAFGEYREPLVWEVGSDN